MVLLLLAPLPCVEYTTRRGGLQIKNLSGVVVGAHAHAVIVRRLAGPPTVVPLRASRPPEGPPSWTPATHQNFTYPTTQLQNAQTIQSAHSGLGDSYLGYIEDT